MRIVRLAALAIGIGILTGCATRPWDPSAQRTYCEAASCPVSVAVTVTSLNPLKCNIDVRPEYLDVSRGDSTKTITWTLTVQGYDGRWPESGIQFDPNAASVLTFSGIEGNKLSFTYKRRTGVHDHYGYGVNALVGSSDLKCSSDPWVVD